MFRNSTEKNCSVFFGRPRIFIIVICYSSYIYIYMFVESENNILYCIIELLSVQAIVLAPGCFQGNGINYIHTYTYYHLYIRNNCCGIVVVRRSLGSSICKLRLHLRVVLKQTVIYVYIYYTFLH